jgi:hypothetical protein
MTELKERIEAFLEDGSTKTLGNLKAGDIHKPSGWTAPAKHARGSVFAEDFGNCAQEYSIKYLKGGM